MMTIKVILLTRDFTLSIPYGEVKEILKKRLNDKFFKGYFDKDDSVLYYRSDFLTISGFTKIPVTEVKIKRGIDSQNETKIEFKIVTPLLVIVSLGIAMLWGIYFFNIDGLRKSDNGFIVPIFGTIFFYGAIFVRYTIELSYFKEELKRFSDVNVRQQRI